MKNRFKRPTNDVIIRIVAFLFLISFAFTLRLPISVVKAADIEPTVVTDSMTIGIKSNYYGIELNNKIQIKNYHPAAVYGYEVANNSIAKIVTGSSNGFRNILSTTVTGLKKGNTTITITETLNGVTNNIGKVAVKVVDAKLDKSMDVGLSSTKLIPIRYNNGLAIYKYKSADKGIATVDTDGYVLGKKIGKTTISVTQTLNNKTIKLGSITVNVKNASLKNKVMDIGLDDGSLVETENYNYEATYTYTSLDRSIVEVDDYGYLEGIRYGTAKVKVTETYQKKTRTVGTLTVHVVKASINPISKSIYLRIGSKEKLLFSDIIIDNIIGYGGKYTCEAADPSIVKCSYVINESELYSDSYAEFYGASLGQTDLTIYEEYNGIKRSLGKVSVSVIEIPVQNLYLFIGDGENGELPYRDYYGLYDGFTVSMECAPYPANTTTPIKYSSSDESVITIDSEGNMKLIRGGKSTITITCGEFSKSFIAVVHEE